MLLNTSTPIPLRDDLTQLLVTAPLSATSCRATKSLSKNNQTRPAAACPPSKKPSAATCRKPQPPAPNSTANSANTHWPTPLRQPRKPCLPPGFASHTPWAQWPRLPIYLKAMTLRPRKYCSNPPETQPAKPIYMSWKCGRENRQPDQTRPPIPDGLAGFKWMIEEWRYRCLRRGLKTPYPVSVKRLLKEWESLNKGKKKGRLRKSRRPLLIRKRFPDKSAAFILI